MYSESDLDAAVHAGAISGDAARAFRNHVAESRATPVADEEHFRLLTGFNDIFVAIALALLLAALVGIGQAIVSPLGGLLATAAAWPLAEYFTRRRRMALPSILLLVAFVGGVAATLGMVVIEHADWIQSFSGDDSVRKAIAGVIAAFIASLTAAAAWLHWRRFTVPITVAAGTLAVVGVALSLIVGLIPSAERAIFPLLLIAGLGVFVVAMRWDISDPERRTRRADVAFWLHLAAAPMIAHALFQLVGVFGDNLGVGQALLVLALYVAFAVVALAVDRRALLVSSLVYVLWALVALFRQAGAVELSAALTGLVIGSALLLLSAFWQPMRARVVALTGGAARFLPPAAAVPA